VNEGGSIFNFQPTLNSQLINTLASTRSSGFRLHQISARQVDAVCRVTEFYAAFAKEKELVADFRANGKFHLSRFVFQLPLWTSPGLSGIIQGHRPFAYE
jgi:hypothetical protein